MNETGADGRHRALAPPVGRRSVSQSSDLMPPGRLPKHGLPLGLTPSKRLYAPPMHRRRLALDRVGRQGTRRLALLLRLRASACEKVSVGLTRTRSRTGARGRAPGCAQSAERYRREEGWDCIEIEHGADDTEGEADGRRGYRCGQRQDRDQDGAQEWMGGGGMVATREDRKVCFV